jgi:hypothetical protein
MADDVRARVTAAIHDALRGLNNGGTARDIAFHHSERLAEAVLEAFGEPETEWATRCGDLWFPAQEVTAKHRARNAAGHALECRSVAVIEDWHATDNDKEN